MAGSVEVPAEVELGLRDLLAVQHLGIAKAAAIGPRRLVRDDDLVAVLDQPHEVEPVPVP